MAFIRNLSNGGVWYPGDTVTFEAAKNAPGALNGEAPSADCGWNLQSYWNYTDLIGSDVDLSSDDLTQDGNLLFDNAVGDLSGAVANTAHSAKTVIDDGEFLQWWQYTITIPETLAPGTYYFKQGHSVGTACVAFG